MKRSWTIFLLVNFILSACAPASAPTPTIAPSAITLPTSITTTVGFESTATSAPEPTPTSTEVVLTPEQQLAEYLKTDEAKQSIDQFVSAMKMAGIEVTADQVNEGLTIKEIKDKDGNPFIVVTYNFDPDPSQIGETLEGKIYIAFGQQDSSGAIQISNQLRKLADFNNFYIGSTFKQSLLNENPRYKEVAIKNFNTVLANYPFLWETIEHSQGSKNFYQADRIVSFAEENNMSIVAQHLVWSGGLPDWLIQGNFSKEEYINLMKQHIIDIMTKYKGKIDTWVVVNEAHWDNEEDFWRKKIGSNYIEIAFQTARETDPSAKLLYSDFQNETSYGKKTYFNRQVVQTLIEKKLIDGIGLHMRIRAFTPPKKEGLIKTFQSYGVPIYITELDIDLSSVKGPTEERFLKQAEIMKTISFAAKESGVCNYFIMFGIGDKYSWLEEDEGKPNADATAFTDELFPKPSYYAMIQGLFP